MVIFILIIGYIISFLWFYVFLFCSEHQSRGTYKQEWKTIGKQKFPRYIYLLCGCFIILPFVNLFFTILVIVWYIKNRKADTKTGRFIIPYIEKVISYLNEPI